MLFGLLVREVWWNLDVININWSVAWEALGNWQWHCTLGFIILFLFLSHIFLSFFHLKISCSFIHSSSIYWLPTICKALYPALPHSHWWSRQKQKNPVVGSPFFRLDWLFHRKLPDLQESVRKVEQNKSCKPLAQNVSGKIHRKVTSSGKLDGPSLLEHRVRAKVHRIH